MEAPRLGLCVAESAMFYAGMDFVEAAQKIISAEAKVSYLLTATLLSKLCCLCDDQMFDRETIHHRSN